MKPKSVRYLIFSGVAVTFAMLYQIQDGLLVMIIAELDQLNELLSQK